MAVLFSSLLLAAGLLAQQYEGAGACGRCHGGIAASQEKSGHARALAAGGTRGEWEFGSGTHAKTWVKQLDERHYLELPQSWFRQTNRMGPTPGHTGQDGVRYRVFDPGAQILRCFACHSTGVPAVKEGGSIHPHEHGVRCESCHGPGAAHVKAGGGKYNIENPGRYQATAINEQCGSCHRQPGADARWDDPWNVRHQPVYLAESACFLQSGGKLSCISCHQPHQALSRDRGAYAAICAGCHKSVQHRAKVSGDCTGCHMPAVAASPDLSFTNHWIGVYSTGAKLRPGK